MNHSDQSLTGALITNDPKTWPGPIAGWLHNDRIWKIATAIALAEGFNDGPGAAPYDLNNPGDLSPGDESGQPVAGPPETHDGSSIIYFASSEAGFIALYLKFYRIVLNRSIVYPADLTWQDVAKKYAGDSANWLKNVTDYLGVDPASTPAQYVNGKAA